MKLIAYNKTERGGMTGGYSSTSIAYTREGRCQVHIKVQSYHSQPTFFERYYADGLLEKLSLLCERYHTTEWTNLPDSDIRMYDAPSGSIRFTFEGGTEIVLGSRKKYPDQFHEMYQELAELINESKAYAVERETGEEAPFMGPLTMGSMFDLQKNMQAASVPAGKPADQNESSANWAKFCGNCGAEFQGTQRFCAECGSPRQRR